MGPYHRSSLSLGVVGYADHESIPRSTPQE
jgi:hypothetical protein